MNAKTLFQRLGKAQVSESELYILAMAVNALEAFHKNHPAEFKEQFGTLGYSLEAEFLGQPNKQGE